MSRFVSAYCFRNDYLYESIYRLSYVEQCTNSAVGEFAYEHMIMRPTRNIQHVLDILVEQGAIPACDSRAMAELWARTSRVCGMMALHGICSEEQYTAITDFLIDIAVRGVRMLSLDELALEWMSAPEAPPVDWENLTTKERIKHTALELFARHGYRRVPVAGIAREMGVKPTTIYRHFRNKSCIVQEIAADLLRHYSSYKTANPPYEAEIGSRTGASPSFTVAMPRSFPSNQSELAKTVYRILYREQFFDENLKDCFVGSILLDEEWVCETLDELVAQGMIPACETRLVAACYVYAMCSFTVAQVVYPHRSEDAEQNRLRAVAVLVSLIMYGFRN